MRIDMRYRSSLNGLNILYGVSVDRIIHGSLTIFALVGIYMSRGNYTTRDSREGFIP